jgi:signal transduction histidine kinase/CheY-like chemotaxis protein
MPHRRTAQSFGQHPLKNASAPMLDPQLSNMLVEHVTEQIGVLDREHRYVYANRELLQFLGRSANHVLGRTLAEVQGQAAYGNYLPLTERLFQGESLHSEGWVELPGMGRRYLSETWVPYARSGGPVLQVAYFGQDHTVRKQREQEQAERQAAANQVERQREALRQSEKLTAMGSLLAGVAHELNNPLAIVMGRASLLEEKCALLPEMPELRTDAQRIREAAERCGRIVRTFLNMARSRPAQRGPVAINDMVRAACDMLQYGYRTHGIQLELALADGLPVANVDGDQIGQVVMNLLVNAQQALADVPGARRVRVQTGLELRRSNREPRVWLRVADNGPGVPAPVRERLFDPFFTTKPEGMGTGMGLAMSRTLARDHGGDLSLEPTPTQGGASFRLSLPISGEAEADSQPAPLPEPYAAQGQRVLVVDDEAELAKLMRYLLESGGYEVATAESGAVALEMLATARFDAIVSDLRMPDMDGAGLWRAVTATYPRLARAMLFVTGDTLSPDAHAFLKSTRCDSLDKPFSRADLLAKVAALLA